VARPTCRGIGPGAGRSTMTRVRCLFSLVLVRGCMLAQGPFEVSCTCRASTQIGLCRIPAVPVFSYQAMTTILDRVQGLAHPNDEPDLHADISPCFSWLQFGLPAEVTMLTFLPTQMNNSPTRSNSSLGRSKRCSRRTFSSTPRRRHCHGLPSCESPSFCPHAPCSRNPSLRHDFPLPAPTNDSRFDTPVPALDHAYTSSHALVGRST